MCAILTISLQLNPMDPSVIAMESAKDPVLAKVMLFTCEGWSPKAEPEHQGKGYSMENFQLNFQLFMVLCYMARESFLLAFNLKCLNSCIWVTLGWQRMKQLAHMAVYWPRIDTDIMNQCHQCSTCAEHHKCQPNLPNTPGWYQKNHRAARYVSGSCHQIHRNKLASSE